MTGMVCSFSKKYVLKIDWKWVDINATGSMKKIRKTKKHMDRGGAQKAMKVVVEKCGIKKSSHPFAASRIYHTSS